MIEVETLAEIGYHADAAQAQQVAGARAALQSFGQGIDYPLPPLAHAFHPFQRGEIDILAAFTGSGKSTAVRSFCFGWLANRVHVIYGGFEMGVEKSRLAFAATAVGIDPGPVLSGRWEQWSDYLHRRAEVEAELQEMADPYSPWGNLDFPSHPVVTPASIKAMGDLALERERGSPFGSIIIVDHMDHLDSRTPPYEASRGVCAAILNHATEYGTRWLCASQLNRSGNVGGDIFWRHRPVQEQMILHGSTKAQIATRVFGVYRPLDPSASPDALKAVREGRADMSTVVSKGLTAFNLVKHRWTGASGTRLLVGYDKGKLTDLPTPDAIAAAQRQHGINTSY